MPSVQVTHADATTDTIDETTEPPGGGYNWFWQRELGEMDKLKIRVDRAAAKNASLEEKADEVELSGVHTGRLVDIEKGGPVWTLVVYGFEWDANRHAPTAGGVKRTQTDAEHMDQFIGSVSEWSIGTTAAQTGDVTYIFNHALAHEGMRRVERNSPGELRWRADGSVDYLDRLGSDKSGSIILTPSNANVIGDLKVVSRGRSMDATHVRLIGAHEGEAQIETNLVPAGDSGTFTNEVTYSNPRWSDASDTDWDRWSNKDLATQDAIDEAANSLAEELVDPHIEVKAAVEGEDLVLGDTVHVEKTEADIDRDMRVKRLTTRQSGARVWDEVLLSTRNLARDTENERVRDNIRYNVAFQGSAVVETAGGGIQAVSSSLNYLLPIFYPDVAFEHTVELFVKSIPYRVFSSGAAAGGGDTTDGGGGDTTEDNADFSSAVAQDTGLTVVNTPQDQWTTVDSISPSVDTSWITGTLHLGSSVTVSMDVRMENTSTSTFFPDSGGMHLSEEGFTVSFTDPTNVKNETLELQVNPNNSDLGAGWTTMWQAAGPHTHGQPSHTHGQPTHVHPINTGVTEFPNETASGVDVLVNGSTEATNIGSGEFETTVDLPDTLTKGQFNLIELPSDTLGAMICTAGIRAYEQIGTN